MRKSIFFGSLIVCLASATALLIWRAKSTSPLLAQTTPPPTTLLVLDFNSLPARVSTDVGIQTSMLKGQIAFSQTLNSSQQVVRSLVGFNAIGAPVRTRRGYTGTLGLKLRKSPIMPRNFDPSSGRIAFAFQEVFHYPLIDQLKGDKRITSDYSASRAEGFRADLTGQFTALSSGVTTETFAGQTQFVLSESVLGGVLGLAISIPRSPVRSVFGLVIGQRGVFVQPVFVRSGPEDLNPTGRSWETFRDRASTIWGKVCVSFVFRQPLYVDNEDYKVIGSDREGIRALNAADNARNRIADAILVLVVETFSPGEGGATTFHAGAQTAGIIVADDNLDLVPPSNNVLAHELGHAFGLCHPERCDPGDDCATQIGDEVFGLARGSIGTVMNNSGAEDNPGLQSTDNWRNISNPLLALNPVLCQLAVDCRSDCGPCTQ